MKINIDNYEIYVVDFLDGKLSEPLKNELQNFLADNPEIWNQIQGIEEMFVVSDKVSFTKKYKLHKNELLDEDTFNQTAVAAIEGELNEGKRKSFDSFLSQYPEKAKSFEIFKASKLEPEVEITFPQKAELYKRSVIVPLFYYGYRIAAVAAIFIFAFIMLNRGDRNENIENNTLAQTVITDDNSISDQHSETEINMDMIEVQDAVVKKVELIDEPSVENTTFVAQAEQITKVGIVEGSTENNGKEDIFDKQTERDILKKLKPREPRQHKYILVVKPTLDNSMLASNTLRKKPMENVLETGEKILNSGKEKIERTSIEKGVLNLLQLASDNRISYETNPNGKVNKINVNAELLAFSLPIRNNK